MADDRPTGAAELALLAGVVVVAFALRGGLALRLGMHVDEPASVMAAIRTAELGLPRFPSGVLYTQGLLHSYLLAPLAWLGRATLADLPLLRVVSVVAGTLALLPLWALGRRAGGPLVGLLAAGTLALDAASLQWSAQVRPYALLQLFTLLAVFAFARGVAEDGRRSELGLAVLAFAAGVFTHVGALLIWPGLALTALLLHGTALAGARRELLGVLGAMLIAPVAFFGINRLAGTSSAADTDALAGGGLRFVGDHLIDPATLLAPSVQAWRDLYADRTLGDVVIGVVLVSAGALAVAWASSDPAPTPARAARTAAMAVFAVGMTAVAFLIGDPQGRYTLHLVGLAYLVPVTLAVDLLIGPPARPPRRLLGAGLGLLWTGLFLGSAGGRLSATGTGSTDHRGAVEVVRRAAAPGEPVLLALTPVAWLMLGDRPNTWFIAGPETTVRAGRYTRPGPEGGRVDYWAGWPSITTVAGLCAMMEQHPSAWFVVDGQRLRDRQGWAGPFARVLEGATERTWTDAEGVRVLRPRPVRTWTVEARRVCEPTGGP